jgi:hypothetical protein
MLLKKVIPAGDTDGRLKDKKINIHFTGAFYLLV